MAHSYLLLLSLSDEFGLLAEDLSESSESLPESEPESEPLSTVDQILKCYTRE